MSQKSIFAVLDAAASTFGSPIVVPHVGVAVRAFTDQVNHAERGNDFFNHAEHFALYELGTYDDVSGVIKPLDIPRLVVQAAAVKIATPPSPQLQMFPNPQE
jgi:hypothetical protein